MLAFRYVHRQCTIFRVIIPAFYNISFNCSKRLGNRGKVSLAFFSTEW